MPAPEITATNGAGASIALSELRGKVVLLTFSEPNCITCDTEMQWFSEFQNAYREDNFVFLNRQVVSASDDVLKPFGCPQKIPTTILIDKSGRIAVTHAGLCTRREYETAIETLLNEP